MAGVSLSATTPDSTYTTVTNAQGFYELSLSPTTGIPGGGVRATTWSELKPIYEGEGVPTPKREIPRVGPVEMSVTGPSDDMRVLEPLESVEGSVLWNVTLVPRHWTTSLGDYEVTDTEDWAWLGEGKWGFWEDWALNGGIWAPCLEPRPIRYLLTNPEGYEGGWEQVIDEELTRREHLESALAVLVELCCGFEETVSPGEEDMEIALWDHYQCPDKEVLWQTEPPWYSVTHWALVNTTANNPGVTEYLGYEIFKQASSLGGNSHGGMYTNNEPLPLVLSDIVSTQIMFRFIRRCHHGDAHNNLVYMVYP